MAVGLRLAPQHRVYAGFAIYAFSMGSVFPRLPDIKLAMGIEEGALGLSLIGTPVGTLTSLTLAAPLLERFGFRRALLTLIPLIAFTYAIAVHAPGPLAFFFLLIPVGLMIGGAEIILNVEADRTEALIGRRIMNRSHSFWSFGFFGAGLFGAVMAQLGASPQMHLAVVVPMVMLSVALLLGRYEPAASRAAESKEEAPKFAAPTGPIMVLVAVTLSAMLLEGASMDWSAIYMRSVFDSGPFVSGFAVATVALSQALARFFADGFVDRYSPSDVARRLLCTLAVGVVLVFFSPFSLLSLVGFALIGIGTSAIFPLAISAAAQRTDRPAPVNVAALAQISFVVFLLGPPMLGFVAEHWGLRWTFGLGLPLVALSFMLSGALGKRQAPGKAARREPAPERARET
jgi:MFS family permease